MRAEPGQAPVPASALPRPDRLGYVRSVSTSGFHKVAYADWGPEDAEDIVVCVHGLTRQGRDFDYLAADLARSGWRVLCPDLPGRGRSDWLPNTFDYVFPQYCADLSTLLAKAGAQTISWVGSSLGGLIGLVLAGMPNSPITRLVVNDIGPEVPFFAGFRIAALLNGLRLDFASLDEAESHFRQAFPTYGRLSDAKWRHIAEHSVALDERTGRYRALLDPKIVPAFQAGLYYQMSLWRYWDDAPAKLMCVRGRESDFLTPSVLAEMKRRRPDVQVLDIDGVGHMPMLMSREEIAAIGSFLQR